MIRSMTGFGRGESRTDGFIVHVEARSVNNRNLRVSFRLPERIQGMESDLEKLVRNAVSRGTVSIVASLDDLSGDPGYLLDVAAMDYYRNELREKGDESIPISTLVTLPGVIRRKTSEELTDDLSAAVVSSLKQALDTLVRAREVEGEFIWKDMQERCLAVAKLVKQVETRSPVMIEEYRQRLSDRLATLLAGIGSGVKEEDVRREIALFADRSDISEEITRMRSHLDLMARGPETSEPYGRKLEFITQEMFREANTMGSKSNDAEMVHAVLDIKAEVEKLREQALNVE